MATPDFSAPIAELKSRLLTAKELFPVLVYFHDELGDKDEFLSKKVCHAAKSPELCAALQAAMETFLKRKGVRGENLTIVRVRGTQFYHGSFVVDDMACNFFYYEDLRLGLLGCNKRNSPMVQTIRFGFQVGHPEPIQN